MEAVVTKAQWTFFSYFWYLYDYVSGDGLIVYAAFQHARRICFLQFFSLILD